MIIEKSASTVFTPLEDRTAVLLDLGTLAYYKLNRTGAAVWEQIEKWKMLAFDDLVRTTVERFEVSEDAARHHLRSFVQQLEKMRVIKVG